MRFQWWQFLALLSLLDPGVAHAQQDLVEIREQGMSEAAARSLTTVASIWGGATLLSVQKLPTGEYESRFTTGFCPRPGADPEEVAALRQKIDERVQAELRRIKPLADRDGSGFVSTEEAAQFREVVLFGLRAAKLETGDRQSPQTIARALGKEPGWVTEKTREYGDLRLRILAAGSSLSDGALPELKL